jgi:zeta-carotene desaturase
VQLRAPVDSYRSEGDRVHLSVGGHQLSFDYAVLAVPFNVLAAMLPEGTAATPLREMLGHFQSSPITGIHFWFDRQVTDLDHAVLLDRTIQWMFHKSKLQGSANGATSETSGSYIELVVSSSKDLVEKPKAEILELGLRELAEFFPEVKKAKILKSTVIKELNATYSPLPGTDAYRAGNVTPWRRVFLAGDWTATGWPATMEGAVRSGYLAAEALVRADGGAERFLVDDLPARGFMRLLGR